MKEKLQSDRGIKLCLYIGFFLLLAYYGGRLDMPIVLDETGTMSNTAFLTGFDWSDNNKAMGGFYYKYFQALLYVPVFMLIKNPFMQYKAIMVLHAAIISVIPVIGYEISRKYLHVEKAKSAILGASVGILPSVILYSQYARADMLMCAVPWFTLYFLLESYDALQKGKKKLAGIYSLLVAFFAVVSYASHTRGIVLVIAVFMTIYLFLLIRKKKLVNNIVFLAGSAVFLIADKFMTAYMKVNVWPHGVKHASAEIFDFEALKLIFTFKGIKSMIKLIIGWVFNAFTSTYGMIALGMLVSVFVIVYFYKKTHEITDTELILAGYGLLNLMGSAALGILFFFKPVYLYFTEEKLLRADRPVYGRYIACAFGVLCLLALYALLCRRDWIKWKGKLAAVLIDAGILGIFAWKVAPALNGKSMTPRNFISISRFLTMPSPGATSGKYPAVSVDLVKAGIYALVIFAILMLLSEMTKKMALIGLIFIIVNAENLNACYFHMRLARNDREYPVTKTVREELMVFSDLDPKYRKIYVGKEISTQLFQMALPDFEFFGFRNRNSDDKLNNIFMILKTDDSKIEKYKLRCFGSFKRGSTEFGYYVKGEELAQEMLDRGYTFY